PDLTWTLTDVGVDLLPSLEAELSGRGGFDGVWEHMRLSGEIDIARMLYDRDIQLLDFLPTLNRELADAPRPPAARRLDLDLHIVAPGELYIENNIARIEARADLRVTGTADRPQLYGRIEALDGTVTVSSRVFELQGGTVDFRPELGLTAALNITLESTIDTRDATYVVDVRVTGTTREPRVVMSSDDPSLSPTDVATLVAVGQTATQFSQGGDAGFSIGLPGVLADPLQQGARQLLPIDRITFESTYSRSTGTFEPQIKLGRDLTDEIAVSLGQTFGLESRTSVEAEYRLTPRVFLTASWESQTSSQEGAFGAGARVRYEFWRVTPYTMLMGWR
ncbi:MAG: translocation/assembly module TamB domain-containing protein, partial [Myxococcota bacterium]